MAVTDLTMSVFIALDGFYERTMEAFGNMGWKSCCMLEAALNGPFLLGLGRLRAKQIIRTKCFIREQGLHQGRGRRPFVGYFVYALVCVARAGAEAAAVIVEESSVLEVELLCFLGRQASVSSESENRRCGHSCGPRGPDYIAGCTCQCKHHPYGKS